MMSIALLVIVRCIRVLDSVKKKLIKTKCSYFIL